MTYDCRVRAVVLLPRPEGLLCPPRLRARPRSGKPVPLRCCCRRRCSARAHCPTPAQNARARQVRSPLLDPDIEVLPTRNLSNTYVHGYVGGTTGLLKGLAPLVMPAQPLGAQTAVMRAVPGARAERVRAEFT